MTVKIDNIDNKTFNIIIADLLGNIVFEVEQSVNESNYNISNLVTGTYTVTLYSENTKVTSIKLTVVK